MSKLVTLRIFLMGRLRNSENGAYIAYGNSIFKVVDAFPYAAKSPADYLLSLPHHPTSFHISVLNLYMC